MTAKSDFFVVYKFPLDLYGKISASHSYVTKLPNEPIAKDPRRNGNNTNNIYISGRHPVALTYETRARTKHTRVIQAVFDGRLARPDGRLTRDEMSVFGGSGGVGGGFGANAQRHRAAARGTSGRRDRHQPASRALRRRRRLAILSFFSRPFPIRFFFFFRKINNTGKTLHYTRVHRYSIINIASANDINVRLSGRFVPFFGRFPPSSGRVVQLLFCYNIRSIRYFGNRLLRIYTSMGEKKRSGKKKYIEYYRFTVSIQLFCLLLLLNYGYYYVICI